MNEKKAAVSVERTVFVPIVVTPLTVSLEVWQYLLNLGYAAGLPSGSLDGIQELRLVFRLPTGSLLSG